MIDVRNLGKDDYAKYALLVIYAWDMCNLDQNPTSNAIDERITTDGWTVQGIITGRDNVIATAPSAKQGVPQQAAGLRQSVKRPGLDLGGMGTWRRRMECTQRSFAARMAPRSGSTTSYSLRSTAHSFRAVSKAGFRISIFQCSTGRSLAAQR